MLLKSDLPFTFLMPANMYGPGDNFDLEDSHVIPAMIRKMIEAEDSVTLWGDGSVTREFLYVDDCVRAIMKAIEKQETRCAVNVGGGYETRIANLAYLIADATGFEGKIIWDKNKPNGQQRRYLDVSRARSMLGFQPETALTDGLRKTVEWYRGAECTLSA